ncbi:hypothetical protein WME94_35760 [Sorangium sp. So ce429]
MRDSVACGAGDVHAQAGEPPREGVGRAALDRETAAWGEPGDHRIASRSVGEPWPFR